MLKRIKLLMLLQMSDKIKFKKVDNIKKLLAKIGLLVLSFIIITSVCGLLFYLIRSVIHISTPKIITFIIVFLPTLTPCDTTVFSNCPNI